MEGNGELEEYRSTWYLCHKLVIVDNAMCRLRKVNVADIEAKEFQRTGTRGMSLSSRIFQFSSVFLEVRGTLLPIRTS